MNEQTTIITTDVETDLAALLIPANADRDIRHRVGRFVAWHIGTGAPWYDPDLAAYRDTLQARITNRGKPTSPATVAASLSAIRAQYTRLLKDNATRKALLTEASEHDELTTAADRKAFVDEVLTRLQNAIDPDKSTVKQIKSQDTPDAAHVRLTSAQATALLASPGVIPIERLRDTAILAMLLCTGIREAELCAMDVADLRQRMGGELALHVREGKGAKERLVPYGELAWALAIVDKWLGAAGIVDGAVFRSFWHGSTTLRGRLSVRAVEAIVAKYPVMIDGELRAIRPHDARRTYARLLYDAGVALVAIQQNLGHANVKTTLAYIGTLDANQRRAPAIITFDLAELARVNGHKLGDAK